MRGQARYDLVVNLAAEREALATLLVTDIATDGGARLAGDHEVQPRRLRFLSLRLQDRDLVAVFDGRAQRHHAAVDLRAHRLVSETRMHGIGEVDRRRALGQLEQFSLRREREDAVLVHRHARMFEDVLGRFGMVEDFDEIADPAFRHIGAFLPLFVRPVRRITVFGLRMHLAGPDLDLDPHLFRMDDRSVQRTVTVALGRRDIILEPPRHHRPAAMDNAQRRIASLLIRHDRAKGHHVRQLFETDVPFGHLFPDREGMFFAAGDIRFHPRTTEQQFQP